MITRTQVAGYLAGAMRENREQAVNEVAAWLIDTRAVRSSRYLAHDVAQILADDGYVFIQVVSARSLTNGATDEIRRIVMAATSAREVEIDATIDPSLIGGVRIQTPSALIDTTIKRKLAEFVEGATR